MSLPRQEAGGAAGRRDHEARCYDSVLDQVRDSLLIRAPARHPERARADLWVQLELALPGGMKDRAALRMVEDAELAGRLLPGGLIVESSSGSMAEGLARVGRLKGYRVIIVSDPRIDELTQAKLAALGAELEIVESYDPVGGWQRSRLCRLREVLDREPGAVWACQYDSPSNAAAYEEVGRRLHRRFGSSLVALVASVGTGGSLCGTATALKRDLPDLRVIAVDAVGSVLFHQPDRLRLQSGHGNSVVPGNLRYEVIDQVHWVSDGEAFNGCRELAARTGVFAGGSSGACYLVGSWVSEQLLPGQSVVAIFPDRGERYYRTIFSDRFLAEKGLVGEVAGDGPFPIRYGIDVAQRWSCADLPHGGSVPYHSPEVQRTSEIAAELGLVAG